MIEIEFDDVATQDSLRQEFNNQMGKPNSEVAQRYLREAKTALEPFIKDIAASGQTKSLAIEIGDEFKATGITVSPVYLAYCILSETLVRGLYNVAIDRLNDRDGQMFIQLFDLYYGARRVNSLITMTEDHLRGSTDQLAVEALDLYRQYNHIPENIGTENVYLQFLKTVSQGAELLTRDKSGFALVDFAVENARQTPTPYQLHPFVVEGAHMARTVYRAIYPQAQQILATK